MELVEDYCSERDLSWSRWPSWSIGSRGKKCLPKEFKMSGTFVIRTLSTGSEVCKVFCFEFGLENIELKCRFLNHHSARWQSNIQVYIQKNDMWRETSSGLPIFLLLRYILSTQPPHLLTLLLIISLACSEFYKSSLDCSVEWTSASIASPRLSHAAIPKEFHGDKKTNSLEYLNVKFVSFLLSEYPKKGDP